MRKVREELRQHNFSSFSIAQRSRQNYYLEFNNYKPIDIANFSTGCMLSDPWCFVLIANLECKCNSFCIDSDGDE